jgi:hypothetical protein
VAGRCRTLDVEESVVDTALGTAAGLVILVLLLWSAHRWIDTGSPPWLLRPAVRLAAWLHQRLRPPKPTLPPVLVGLELRRLSEEVRKVDDGDPPRKAERLAARTLAYDLALRDYARLAEIPVPEGHLGLTREQRFELESALISAGYDW